jgi:SPP1 family predicted phage head-tail adaptor
MLSELNQRATLFARTLTPDSGGGFTESWNAFATVWIALKPRDATDIATANRLESKVRHIITLRRRTDLAAGQRLTIGPRTFRIHAVLDAHQTLTTLHVEELP